MEPQVPGTLGTDMIQVRVLTAGEDLESAHLVDAVQDLVTLLGYARVNPTVSDERRGQDPKRHLPQSSASPEYEELVDAEASPLVAVAERLVAAFGQHAESAERRAEAAEGRASAAEARASAAEQRAAAAEQRIAVAEERSSRALERAEVVRHEADEYAKVLIASARQNADQVIAEARLYADKALSEGQAEAERNRRAAQRQIDELVRQRDSIAGHLDQLRHLLGARQVPPLDKLATAAGSPMQQEEMVDEPVDLTYADRLQSAVTAGDDQATAGRWVENS